MRSTLFSAPLPVLALALCMTVGLSASAQAQAPVNHLYDKFVFGLTGADVVLGTDIQINNSTGTAGTTVNLADLGISKSAFAPSVGAAWRPGRRHQLEVSYLHIDRSGDKALTDTIYFADTSFAAGVRVKTTFAAPTVALSYRFAFLAKEKTQLGFQLGLGALFFDLGITAQAGATPGGTDTVSVSYSANKKLVGPTAALGLYGAFRASDHWYFGLNAGAIGVTVSNITATTWLGSVDARYYLSSHWALGAGWSINGIKVTSSGNEDNWLNLSGSIKYTFQVFRLGVVYALQ